MDKLSYFAYAFIWVPRFEAIVLKRSHIKYSTFIFSTVLLTHFFLLCPQYSKSFTFSGLVRIFATPRKDFKILWSRVYLTFHPSFIHSVNIYWASCLWQHCSSNWGKNIEEQKRKGLCLQLTYGREICSMHIKCIACQVWNL